ncbi:MAG TPA: Dabb family protein [Candidatus Hydrogenedentes bacterium]|nr:Dabb family protein [Candidatus Hydrogenedentota bacterium]
MLIHLVLFKLRPDLSPEERNAFRKGLESLRDIPGVVQLWMGPPAATPPRPVVIRDYDIGLVVCLGDTAAHDAYQEHPVHQAFVATFRPCWERITVVDVDA